MRYSLLLALVAFATFGLASTAVAAGIAACWRQTSAVLARFPPKQRARVLFRLRMTPATVGVLSGLMAIVAFMRYEPRSTTELPGSLLIVSAALGSGLLLAGTGRLALSCWKTIQFLSSVERAATEIRIAGVGLRAFQLDTPFPLVAVAGFLRPRLLVARRVLEEIPEDEIQVIVEHELAHARRRDNVARLIVIGMPDVLSLAERWLRLDRAWCDAAEEAADDLATGDDADARARLASALVHVARMVGQHSAPRVPLLAFHDGETVERRVRRLLAGRPFDSRPGRPAWRVAVLVVLFGALPLVVLPSIALLPTIHSAIEWLVNAHL